MFSKCSSKSLVSLHMFSWFSISVFRVTIRPSDNLRSATTDRCTHSPFSDLYFILFGFNPLLCLFVLGKNTEVQSHIIFLSDLTWFVEEFRQKWLKEGTTTHLNVNYLKGKKTTTSKLLKNSTFVSGFYFSTFSHTLVSSHLSQMGTDWHLSSVNISRM